MVKFLIWGIGGVSIRNYKIFKKMDWIQDIEVIGFVDNNSQKWGDKIDDLPIIAPSEISGTEYDYICIFSRYKNEITRQLVEELGISEGKIKNIFDPYIECLKARYASTEDAELKEVLERIEQADNLSVYYFTPAQDEHLYEAFFDEAADLHYILFEDKRLYLKRNYGFTIIKGKQYVKDIWYEQDLNSPHLYEEGEICVNDGDVLIDAGVCEGNFSLHNIDKVSKVYLIECDEDWMEALRHTFEPYKEKVVFCNKFLSDSDSEDMISLDTLLEGEPVQFIKMDIEGEELKALQGAERTLRSSKGLKCAICAYHRHGDEEKIKAVLQEYHMKTSTSKGYMLFLFDDAVLKEPELRRGIVRAIAV